MGNDQSFAAPVDHSRFAKAQFSSTAMMIRVPIPSKKYMLSPWMEKTKLYAHIYDSPDILKPSFYEVEESGLCGDSCNLVMKFDDILTTNLKDEIIKRQSRQVYFTQQEIWQFALIITRAAAQVYSHGEKHFLGNVHPYNILINSKKDIKIMAANYSYSMPGLVDHFQEYKQHGDSQAFISPELIGFLNSNRYAEYPDYPRCVDKQMAEFFCTGMTLLSIATLETHMMKCFRAENSIINKRLSAGIKRAVIKQDNPSPVCSIILKSMVGQHISNIEKEAKSAQSIFLLSQIRQEPSQSRSINDNSSYMSLINHVFLENLLSQVKQRYSSTLYELIVALMFPDPLLRMRVDKLYNEFMRPVQKQILSGDLKWLTSRQQSFEVIEQQADVNASTN